MVAFVLRESSSLSTMSTGSFHDLPLSLFAVYVVSGACLYTVIITRDQFFCLFMESS